MDACHVGCYRNSTDGEIVKAVADSGAGATLIVRELYEKLKDQGVRMKQGIQMRLVQLTGDVKCEGYVTLSLYFRSQLGLVRLQNVEAYVLKGLTIPLLIGEDVQTPWDLSTIRQDGTM